VDTDRNLLFGVLALQADLITGDQFAEACSAWAARKTVPLADLLVERGWLEASDRADIEKLLERKLRKHGGEARESLAEVTTDQVRQSLAGVDDPEVRRTFTPPPQAHVLIATTDQVPETGERYTLSRLHATGGIGRVWLAKDARLGRDVALKELRPERVGSPVIWARFLREAQVTGQLEHPGIVPIYELGKKPEGDVPFYTMRFVRGRTLAEAAASYHARRQRRKAGPLELRELLTAFVGVCQSVAYAHSRGVLHRDLKPQNVVLGDYGEVIVLDWGLAKVIGEAEEGAPPLELSAAEAPAEVTVHGQVLGTPAYMPPEQAEGRLDLVDVRSDVYGLGAVLYEILTGTPPFTGPRTEALLRRVAHEPPTPPREVVPRVPRALEAVCLKALSKKPANRYASAKKLAAEVQRWLADEPVTVYRGGLADWFARWVRRNRSWAWAGSVCLGVVAFVTMVAAVAIYLSRQEEIKARTEADKNRAEAEDRRVDALQNLDRATRNLRTAQDAVRDTFHQLAATDLASVPGAGKVRLQLANVALTYNERFLAENPDNVDVRWDAGDMFRTMGGLYAGANQPEQSLAFYRRSLEQFRQLIADANAKMQLRDRLLGYQIMLAKVCREAGAMLRARGRHAEARHLLDEGLALLGPHWDLLPSILRVRGTADDPSVQDPVILEIWPADPLALPAPPGDHAREYAMVQPFLRVKGQLLVELARLHLDEGRTAEALALYDRLVAFFRAGTDAAGRPAAEGVAQIGQHPVMAHYRQYSRPEMDFWYLGWALRGRALALNVLGRPAEADAAYAEAIRRLEGKDRPDDRYLLVIILVDRGVARSAAADLDRGLSMLEQLSRDFGTASYRREYARALIAHAGQRAGNQAAATADYRTAREVSEKLIAESEGKPAADDLANLADALSGQGGADALQQAVGRYEKALAICPAHIEYRRKLETAKARAGGS
jgi:tetratricopeptide (TPR) repeat protein/tRNA A-37 threonylcarbamoyl transferase component Bud32